MIGLGHYLTVAAILFVTGIFGIFLNRKNVIVILMSVELMLLAVNINFVAFSAHLNDLVGQVFTMFVLTVAAAEAAIGLAILVCFFRNRGTIAVEDVNVMKAEGGAADPDSTTGGVGAAGCGAGTGRSAVLFLGSRGATLRGLGRVRIGDLGDLWQQFRGVGL